MFSNYPFEMSRLLFTMLFSPHGWAPPISWHMCNILRSPCLPFASHVPKVSEKEKSAIHEVYTPNLEREISNHRGLHNFYVTSFPSRGYHRHLDVILRNRRRARFEKKNKKGRVFDYPDWKRGEIAILYLFTNVTRRRRGHFIFMRSFKITLLPCYSHFSHVFVSSLSLTIRRR